MDETCCGLRQVFEEYGEEEIISDLIIFMKEELKLETEDKFLEKRIQELEDLLEKWNK